jgi:hypothetical protein
MADKKNVVATEPGTGTQESLQTQETFQTKDELAKEEAWVLDCLEDDEVREALDRLHARDEKTPPSQG